jgi:DNA-binding beta-propeller fold protein YncE
MPGSPLFQHERRTGPTGDDATHPVLLDELCPPVPVVLSAEVAASIAGMGRTEDVAFSPDNRRLAIAGFGRSVVYLLDVEIGEGDGAPPVLVLGVTEIRSSALRDPHGLGFLDQDLLVVANRGGEAPIFRLPPPAAGGVRQVEVTPVATIRSDEVDGVSSPGSVVASRVAADLHEVLICNNYANSVSRHLVDGRGTPRIASSQALLAAGLAIPDGVTVSADHRWVAISNHDTHSVLLFPNEPDLHPGTTAHGVLHGVAYPHGLRFTADGEALVVADAGAPYLHVYRRGDGCSWDGARGPARTIRVMDDETFERGRYNPQEGGPKGFDIDRTGRLAVVSSEHQPLAFFDLARLLGAEGSPEGPSGGHPEALRTALLREERVATALRHRATEAEAAVADLQRRVAEAEEVAAGRAAVVTDLEQTLQEQAGQLAELTTAVAALGERVAAAEADALAARTAERHQRDVADDRERQLAAIHRSRSWRITAPVRRLTGALPHRRQAGAARG